MKNWLFKFIFNFLFFIFSFPILQAKTYVKVIQLRTENQSNPVGLATVKPRLSWQLVSSEKNVLQTAYHIRAAATEKELNAGKNLLWDSKIVTSGNSVLILYKGKQLKSRDKIYWHVKAFTTKGNTQWSETASFQIGLLSDNDWSATWIGLDKLYPGDTLANHSRLSARYLRKEFSIAQKTIIRGTLYISGLGLYEAFVNGKKTGDYALAPTLTDYDKSVKYNTFDITTLLNNKNTISVVLGNGRFFSTRYTGSGRMRHFGFPKMIAQIEIEYKDGSRQTIVSDTRWKITTKGLIRANNEFDGEEYDARMELKGWKATGYDDSDWLQAEIVSPPKGRLEAQTNPNIKVMDKVFPKKITRIAPDVFILDMGQNMVGWLQMKVSGKAGDRIKLRFAEQLKSDGSIYTSNLRSASATDTYICNGDGEEIWEPTFVYHGFRFVEISGNKNFVINDFVGKVIYDEMETIGTFETSDTTLNQLYKNAYWGIRGNYRSIPTDCPQRDERQGWLGDRTTGALGESFLFDNQLLYAKWLDDIQLSQREDGSIPDVAPQYWTWSGFTDNITWPSAYITVADMLFRQFGDLNVVAKHYDSMKRWLKYMKSKYLVNGIMTKDKYGDWCVPPELPNLIHSKDTTRMTDGALISTAYYYRMLGLMENFATLLKKSEDVNAFETEKEFIKTAFNTKYFDKERSVYSNNTVTANILPLYFGMIPAGYEKAVFKQITNRIETEYNSHVSSGVVGIQWLMRTLTVFERADLALKIATNRTYPSWGYMIENGATTIWELWNGNTADPTMNSGNHVMLLGDLLIWLYEELGGIRQAATSSAFKQVILKPNIVNGLNFVKTSLKTPYGLIVSNWKKEGNKLIWKISIPCNSSAKVYLPSDNTFKIEEYGSGNYNLKIDLN